MHGTQTVTIPLSHPVPVLIVYATGFAGEDNIVYFLPDIYSEDKSLLNLLEESRERRDKENKKDIEGLSGAIDKITENKNSERP